MFRTPSAHVTSPRVPWCHRDVPTSTSVDTSAPVQPDVTAPAEDTAGRAPARFVAGPRPAGTHAVLRLLGDPERWRILVLLATEQLSTRHLQAELEASAGAVSRHLRLLRDAGLVEASRVGRASYHRLVPGALDDVARLVGMLAEAPGGHVPRRPADA